MIAFITCSCDGVFILLAVGRAFTNRSWASVYFLQLGWRLLFYYLHSDGDPDTSGKPNIRRLAEMAVFVQILKKIPNAS